MAKERTSGKATCLQPFTWLEVHPEGSVFCCCPSWRPRPLGNLLDQSLEEIWWGAAARQFRAAVLQGDFLGCRTSRCPHLATRSGPVGPLTGAVDPELARKIGFGAEFPDPPRQIKLCFDTRCNLTCPSCCDDRRMPASVAASHLAWLQQRVVRDLLPLAETLIVAGQGEPFAAPAYREILGALDRQSLPRLRSIHLHSNGQLWTPAAWAGLPGLHGLVKSAEISVDAASAATYAVNRRGGSFNGLLKNLEFIHGLGLEVLLSFVVQANNVREMDAFCRLAAGFGWRCAFSRLVNWGTFSRTDYAARAVHLPGHPQHRGLLEMLEVISSRPRVCLGNLAPLIAV